MLVVTMLHIFISPLSLFFLCVYSLKYLTFLDEVKFTLLTEKCPVIVDIDKTKVMRSGKGSGETL